MLARRIPQPRVVRWTTRDRPFYRDALSMTSHTEDHSMGLRFLSAALAIAFLSGAAVQPALAQDKKEKKTTAQQQKMKDCAGKWKVEKTEKKVSGRAEYRKFMSACLKG
jgi:hypothetical protein